MAGLTDLIEGLTILERYADPEYPTHCEHDVLIVCIDPDLVSEEDKEELSDLGFHNGYHESAMDRCFYSYRFGSA